MKINRMEAKLDEKALQSEIILDELKSVNIVTKEEVFIDTNKISVDVITDNRGAKTITALVSFFHSSGITKTIVLFEGDSYVSIGTLTDDMINEKIKQLI